MKDIQHPTDKKPDKYNVNLCEGPLVLQIIMYAFPLFCSMLLQLTFNAADLIVVGRYASPQSMAAVGSTGSLTTLCINLLLGLSTGAAVLTAQYFGAKDYKRLHKVIHTAMYLAIIGGLFMTVFGRITSHSMLKMMGSPDDIIGKATLYMWICFIGMPFQMVYNFGSAIMRSLGDTKRPLYFLTIAGVVNVILNMIFVIAFRMDVAGVALATVASHAISSLLVWRALSQNNGPFQLRWKYLHFHKEELIKLLKIGIPSGLQGSCFSFSNTIIQSSVNSLGSMAVAGNAAALSMEGIVYTGSYCFFYAALTFAGQNYGGKKYKRIKHSIFACSALTMLLTEALGFGFVLFAHQCMSIFNTDPEVIRFGMERMFVSFLAYGLCGTMDVTSGALRGLGYTLFPSISIFLSVCVYRIIWCYTVFDSYHTMTALMLSYPISWFMATLVNGLYLWYVCKKHIGPKLKQRKKVS